MLRGLQTTCKESQSLSKNSVKRYGLMVVLLGIVLYTVLFTYWQIQLYRGLHMGITDLAFFDQAMYNTLHGRALHVSFVPSPYRDLQLSDSPHLFAPHSYVLMPLLVFPIYALVPHTYTLFFIQAFAGAIGALAIYLLADDLFEETWPAVALSLAYLLNPTLQYITTNMFTFGFHPENLFPPLFMFSFYFLYKRKWISFWVSFVFSVLVVESYSLVCAALGAYVIVRWPRRRWQGICMVAISLAWLVLSFGFIIPHYRGDGGVPWFVSRMGGGRVFLEQIEKIPTVIVPLFIKYMASMLGPFLFLPLLGLQVVVIALPILVVNFSAGLIGYGAPVSYTGWQSNPVVAVLALSSVFGLAWLRQRVRATRHILMSVAIVAVALCCDIAYGPLPFSLSVEPGQYDVDPARVQVIERVREMIPEEAILSADYRLGSQFTRRPWLYMFPDRLADADYVLVDRSHHWTTMYQQEMIYLSDSSYHEAVLDMNDIVLYRRLPDPHPPMQRAVGANFGGKIKLLGYTIEPEDVQSGDTLRLVLYWQPDRPLDISYVVFVHLLGPDGRLASQEDSRPMDNLYPTTDWTPGEIVTDGSYELSLPADRNQGEYVMEIGMYDPDTGQRLDVMDHMGHPQDTTVTVSVYAVD